jgi:hypothetical protein
MKRVPKYVGAGGDRGARPGRLFLGVPGGDQPVREAVA